VVLTVSFGARTWREPAAACESHRSPKSRTLGHPRATLDPRMPEPAPIAQYPGDGGAVILVVIAMLPNTPSVWSAKPAV
jgi:hypothetical protein